MKSKTIRILTAIFAFLLILSAVFFWLESSLEEKYGDIITLYMLHDFSAISTIVFASIIILLQLIKPKLDSGKEEIID
jgi:hypothetical protein